MKTRLLKTFISFILIVAMLLIAGMPASGDSLSAASSSRISGDLNGDGEVDMADVVLLLQHTLFPDLYPVDYPGSLDLSDDGNEDLGDVVLLLQHSLFPGIYSIKEIGEAEPYIYKHVVILGVDGAGTFFRQADTPNIDRIFENGSISYKSKCMEPSSSGPNWGSMLHGVLPEYHRCTNDSTTAYPSNSKFPSIFRVIRENDPSCVLASFNNWTVINQGLIEANLGIYMDDSNDDGMLANKIVSYLENNQPKLMFVQFDSVDAAGHENGYGSSGHLEQISTVDSYIGLIYDKMVETGMMEDTLLIVVPDHGGTVNGAHGGNSKEEMTIMVAIAGKTVLKGQMEEIEVRDIAAIVLFALGIEQPATYSAKVPGYLFPGVDATPRVEYVAPPVQRYDNEGMNTPADGSGRTIFDYINRNNIVLYMPLDGNVADKVGTYSTSQKDRLDYVSGYYGQGADVKAGSILTDFNPGTGSFSVSCWVKFTAKPDDPCIFSNKDWSKGTNKGFVLSYRGDDIKFNAGNGSSRNDFEFSLPQDFMNGWMFLVFVVDRNAGTIGLSLDFSYIKTFQLTGALRSATFNGLGGLVFGQDGTGYYASLPAIMDEVAIYNKALTSAEIASLKEYYNAQRVY